MLDSSPENPPERNITQLTDSAIEKRQGCLFSLAEIIVKGTPPLMTVFGIDMMVKPDFVTQIAGITDENILSGAILIGCGMALAAIFSDKGDKEK